jgi:vancomycin resistance protein YoaR
MSGGRRLALALLALLLVVLGVGAALAAPGDDGNAPDEVRVDGVDVSGLPPDEVERAVRQRARELMHVPVVIERADAEGFRVRATRASLGARPRIAEAVEEALEPRGFGSRFLSRLGVAPARDVDLRFTVDDAKVDRLVARVSTALNDPPVPARLRVTRTDIVELPGKGGYGVDPVALKREVAALTPLIEVSRGPLAPPVSDEAAAEARERALALIQQPVQVAFHGRGAPIEPSVLRSALRFVPDPPNLRVALAPDILYERIRSAYQTREQPARDATFRVVGDRVRLVPSRIGRALDMDAIAEEIAENPPSHVVRARFRISRPERTTAEARALRITEQISGFTTPYNCCEPRVTNIQEAAAILNGWIIPAGGRFSLNEALGPRTPDRGFVSAPQIAGGRLEDAIGGGVSQVATTMFNAAFFAGLDLVAHTPHQFYISRYPPGREATVSAGGPELVFVNDWPAAVLIDAQAGSNGITIRFFSSKLGRRVETETGEPHDYVQPKERETVDRSLPPGAREVEQSLGGPGFTIGYTRKVYDGDTLKRDESYTWTYDPEDAFIKVGPKRSKPAKPEAEAPDQDGDTTAPDDGGTAAPGGSTTAPDRGTTTSRGAAPQAPSGGAAAPPPTP